MTSSSHKHDWIVGDDKPVLKFLTRNNICIVWNDITSSMDGLCEAVPEMDASEMTPFLQDL